MRAVVREGSVRLVHREGVRVPGEVTVAVRRAGICRTDLYVADGLLAVDEPRTLGHEAVGVVVDGDGPLRVWNARGRQPRAVVPSPRT